MIGRLVLSDFSCAMSLPCPWETERGWKILMSKCVQISVGLMAQETAISFWKEDKGGVLGGGCVCE